MAYLENVVVVPVPCVGGFSVHFLSDEGHSIFISIPYDSEAAAWAAVYAAMGNAA